MEPGLNFALSIHQARPHYSADSASQSALLCGFRARLIKASMLTGAQDVPVVAPKGFDPETLKLASSCASRDIAAEM